MYYFALIIMFLSGIVATLYFGEKQDQTVLVFVLMCCTFLAGMFIKQKVIEDPKPKMLSYEWARDLKLELVYIGNDEGGIDVVSIDWNLHKMWKNGIPWKDSSIYFNEVTTIRELFDAYMVFETLQDAALTLERKKSHAIYW